MKNRISSLTGFFGRILLTSSRKDARLVISDAVNEDEAITKRQLNELSTIVTTLSEEIDNQVTTRIISWDNGVDVPYTDFGDDQDLLNITIPENTFTKFGQSIEVEVWGTMNCPSASLGTFFSDFDNNLTIFGGLGTTQANKTWYFKSIIKAVDHANIFTYQGNLIVNQSTGASLTYVYNNSSPGSASPIGDSHILRFTVNAQDGLGASIIKQGHLIKFIESTNTNL